MFSKDVFDIIVLGGQSNAEGFGLGDVSEEYIPDERVLFLKDDANPRFEKDADDKDVFKIDASTENVLTVGEEPIGDDGKIGKLALIFAKNYIDNGLLKDGRKILIVNAAVGGTGFARNEWGKTGVLYERLKRMTADALNSNPKSRLVALLWHQGECDSFENADWEPEKRYTVHKQNLISMFGDFEAAFDCAGLPMITAGFCDEWYLKNKTPCDAVMRAMAEFFSGSHRRFVDASGLLSNNEKIGNGDDIHFCRESAHILGKKFFDAYLGIKKQTKP